MILWLDIETYSEIDIKNGAYRYAEGADVILFAYAIDDAPARVVDVLHGEEYPAEVMGALADPDCVLIAHNAMFDRTVLKKFIPAFANPRRWKDSMIKAYSLSLPGSLASLCEYCGLPVDKAKDKEGAMLIRKFCLPQKSGQRLLPFAQDADWRKFINYARLDVEAMREVWKRLPGWNDTPAFWGEWHIDQDINDRGMQIDLALASCAIEASAEVSEKSNAKVRRLTNGAAQTAGQRDVLMRFMDTLGYDVTDMRKSTLEAALEDPTLPDEARELILARLQSAKASVKKYEALMRATCSDGRMRGCLMFCGGQKTGRWAGKIFQPQNLPRGTLSPSQVEVAVDAIKHGAAHLLYDDVNEVVSSCLRGSIVAPPGKKLVVADLSNIEGRVLAWLAREEWKLEAFRAFDRGEGVDLYKATYARTFGIRPEDVTKAQRQIGKVLELAMGYMGGVGSFLAFATAYGADLKELAEHTFAALPKRDLTAAHDQWDFFAERDMTNGLDEMTWTALNAIKLAWRAAHPAITRFWRETELHVMSAMGEPYAHPDGGPFPVEFHKSPFGLACRLPSGRVMAYPRAELPDDGERCLFKFYAPLRVRKGFGMNRTHAGKLVENITQATARDVLAANLVRIENAGYKIILSVHDELIAETPDMPEYNAEALSALMATPPAWAKDLPLAAAGFEAYRYKKD